MKHTGRDWPDRSATSQASAIPFAGASMSLTLEGLYTIRFRTVKAVFEAISNLPKNDDALAVTGTQRQSPSHPVINRSKALSRNSS